MANHAPDVPKFSRTMALQEGIDGGLRQFLLSVYNYMTSGLALAGLIAYPAADAHGF